MNKEKQYLNFFMDIRGTVVECGRMRLKDDVAKHRAATPDDSIRLLDANLKIYQILIEHLDLQSIADICYSCSNSCLVATVFISNLVLSDCTTSIQIKLEEDRHVLRTLNSMGPSKSCSLAYFIQRLSDGLIAEENS